MKKLKFIFLAVCICVPSFSSDSVGIYATFKNESGSSDPYITRHSVKPENIEKGEEVYRGKSRVLAILPYRGGVLTAFSHFGRMGFGVVYSSSGDKLDVGERRYEGVATITAMCPYKGGVLTAFGNCDNKLGNYCVHFSPDGKDLGKDNKLYEGVSAVTAMVPYDDGVMIAFRNSGGAPIDVIRFTRDLKQFGSGELRYQGAAMVRHMTAFDKGVLVSFISPSGPLKHFVRFSPDGKTFEKGERYRGGSPIRGMFAFEDGVLMSFAKVGGLKEKYSIVYSADGKRLGEAPHLYEGSTSVISLSQDAGFNAEAATAFSTSGDYLGILHTEFLQRREAAVRPGTTGNKFGTLITADDVLEDNYEDIGAF